MLEKLPIQFLHERAFRYANQLNEVDFLQSMGLNTQAVEEVVKLLRDRQEIDSLEMLLDKPFKPKPQLEKHKLVSRYSDGSIKVFYSALERETAEAEVKHFTKKYLMQHSIKPRTVYFLRLTCDFSGSLKDLREKQNEWTWLIHDSDYAKCHGIAREAVEEGLDGLLAPSARRNSGTCLPVFKRTAISNPASEDVVSFTFDPSTNQFLK